MTKLEAVNLILDSIGESPVSSLSTGYDDADDAVRFLDRVTREVLALGWTINTEYEVIMTPDGSNEIPLSGTVLRIDTAGKDAWINVTVRDNGGVPYLYNIKKRSFTFDVPTLTTEVVWDYDFEELTFALQNYIAYHAAVLWQVSELGSAAVDQMLQRKERQAWEQLLDADGSQGDYNVLLDSPSVNAIVRRNNWLYGR